MTLTVSITGALLAFLFHSASPLAPPQASGATSDADTWAVKGIMADGCQCRVFCPCEFNSNPSEGRCDDAAILAIEKGHFGKTSLDGLSIVVVSQSPQGERMVDNVGKLTFARLYVSNTVKDDQAQALAEVARRILGTFVKDASRISADEKVTKVELKTSVTLKNAEAQIPKILDLKLEANGGGDAGSPILIKNSPWSAPGVGDVIVAHSTVYKYDDEGRHWDYAGRSASFRTVDMKDSIAPQPHK
jgi:hypothetical protein